MVVISKEVYIKIVKFIVLWFVVFVLGWGFYMFGYINNMYCFFKNFFYYYYRNVLGILSI